jgi:methionyl-tRNA formyltransferase
MCKDKTKVLFFANYNCQYSQQALEHLKHLGFDVQVVLSKNRDESLPTDIDKWSGEYILCFRSYFIIPKYLIDRASIAAINFHPAPTEYPGSGSLNWALYENAQTYGATAHLMNENIDNGAILECRRFPILLQDNVLTLMERSHSKTFDLFVDITIGLALEGKLFLEKKLHASSKEKWSGQARKMFEIDRLQIVDPNCSKEELEQLIRSTYTPNFPLEIHLHGYRFVLKI